MRKLKFIAAVLSLAMLCAVALTGCGSQEKEYELSHYSGEDKDVNGNTVYNTELFYSNQVQQGYPDPQVLDDTARTGYYYLFGTSGSFTTMRSRNLAEWEDVGPTFFQRQSEEVRKATTSNMWAPEVIYDEESKLYYMFFSATPEEDSEYPDANAGQGVVTTSLMYNMYVATSSEPSGPYTMVDFSKSENCHRFEQEDGSYKGRVHNGYNTERGKVLSDMTEGDELTGKYAYVKENGTYYEAAFPHYWAKYCLFSPDELSKLLQKNKVGTGGTANTIPEAGYFATIDPHPFVDPVSNKKYMYFKCEGSGWNINIVVEMMDWLTPDWSNAQYVTANNYYTIEDWRTGENRGVSYESSECNEGPHVIYHEDKNGKGLYYFTYSMNDYATSAYQVGMAVSDSPMGPFRKLTEAEGGLLLCARTARSKSVSGAGHHSFVTLGDQTFINYHRHNDFLTGGTARYTAMDELRWITVKDINGQDMDIPYVNGPTDSMQPLPEAASGYTNVAEGMTAACSDNSVQDISCATDGLLSVHKTADATFMDYIRETYITETATFTFDFSEATSIRAILVYNSAFESSVFYNISKIELILADGSTRMMRDIAFDTEQYCQLGGQNGDRLIYVKSGTAAFAEFYDIEVTSVKITVDVPEGQDRVGISEIRILGKA